MCVQILTTTISTEKVQQLRWTQHYLLISQHLSKTFGHFTSHVVGDNSYHIQYDNTIDCQRANGKQGIQTTTVERVREGKKGQRHPGVSRLHDGLMTVQTEIVEERWWDDAGPFQDKVRANFTCTACTAVLFVSRVRSPKGVPL